MQWRWANRRQLTTTKKYTSHVYYSCLPFALHYPPLPLLTTFVTHHSPYPPLLLPTTLLTCRRWHWTPATSMPIRSLAKCWCAKGTMRPAWITWKSHRRKVEIVMVVVVVESVLIFLSLTHTQVHRRLTLNWRICTTTATASSATIQPHCICTPRWQHVTRAVVCCMALVVKNLCLKTWEFCGCHSRLLCANFTGIECNIHFGRPPRRVSWRPVINWHVCIDSDLA